MSEFAFIDPCGREWEFTAERSKNDPPVWFHFCAGAVSGGAHLTVEQARRIAHLLTVACDQAEIAAQRVEENA